MANTLDDAFDAFCQLIKLIDHEIFKEKLVELLFGFTFDFFFISWNCKYSEFMTRNGKLFQGRKPSSNKANVYLKGNKNEEF